MNPFRIALPLALSVAAVTSVALAVGAGCSSSSAGPLLSCGEGTLAANGQCVSLAYLDAAAVCGPGTTWSGSGCVPVAEDATTSCGPGTTSNGSGECVPVPAEGGVTCGAGTVLSGGICVLPVEAGTDATVAVDAGGNDGGGEGGADVAVADAARDAAEAAASACSSACASGQVCADGGCVSCGAMDEPCCASGSACNSGLTCDTNDVCSCGQPGEACCTTTPNCSSGSTCNEQNVCACGAAGEVCCAATSGQSACSGSSLQCDGKGTGDLGSCSCIVACSQGVVERSDGTLWVTSANAPVEITSDGTNPLIVKSFQAEYTYGNGSTPYFCAVTTAGNVVCQGPNDSGQLGYGSASTTAVTVPVTVQAGASALTGITQVFVDTVSGELACAINASGAAWCWGQNSNGQLGNGGTSNQLSAYPVLGSGTPQAPGPPFTGVQTMGVAGDHVCAVKTDGTLWCWGSNSVGQIGIGSTSTAQYPNPVQITTLGTNVVDLAVSSGNNQFLTCVRTKDTTVWCWGTNDFGSLANGTTDNNAHPTPVQITNQPDGGGPLSNVTALAAGGGGNVYVVQTNPLPGYPNYLSCWGSGCGNGTSVTPVTRNSTAVTGVFQLCPQNSFEVYSYIDSTGQMWFPRPYSSNGGPTVAPSCP